MTVLRVAVLVGIGSTGCAMGADHAAAPGSLATFLAIVHPSDITAAIRASIFLVVFVNVLVQQLGVPVPATPTLLIAGSVASSPAQVVELVAVAVLASLLADTAWYAAGRAFGYRVLSGLCKLSLNPESCATTAESLFRRWGAWSLVGAKLVPGFSIIGPPIAGALKIRLPAFFAASTIGAALWAGAHIVAGWIWRDEVQRLVEALVRNGTDAVGLLAVAMLVWLGWIVWRRRRFRRSAAIGHVSPDELMRAMAASAPLLLLDLRGSAQIAELGGIDGATPALLNDLRSAVDNWKAGDPIVTLCACPGDATAVRAAHLLGKLGFTDARPLRGGYEAWVKHLRETAPQRQVVVRPR